MARLLILTFASLALALATASVANAEQQTSSGQVTIFAIDTKAQGFTALGVPRKLQPIATDALAAQFRALTEQIGPIFRGVQTVGDYSLDTVELHVDFTTEGKIVVFGASAEAGLKIIYKRAQPKGGTR